jgi:hypothetical protein
MINEDKFTQLQADFNEAKNIIEALNAQIPSLEAENEPSFLAHR